MKLFKLDVVILSVGPATLYIAPSEILALNVLDLDFAISFANQEDKKVLDNLENRAEYVYLDIRRKEGGSKYFVKKKDLELLMSSLEIPLLELNLQIGGPKEPTVNKLYCLFDRLLLLDIFEKSDGTYVSLKFDASGTHPEILHILETPEDLTRTIDKLNEAKQL